MTWKLGFIEFDKASVLRFSFLLASRGRRNGQKHGNVCTVSRVQDLEWSVRKEAMEKKMDITTIQGGCTIP